jgi:hypothetical protein
VVDRGGHDSVIERHIIRRVNTVVHGDQ